MPRATTMVFLLCISFPLLACGRATVPNKIQARIDKITGNPISWVRGLATLNRTETICALMSSLSPVKPGKYHVTRKDHVIWYLRALKALTGKEFRARSHESVPPDAVRWLGSDKLRFFATWMSRDLTFVAPHDAQRRIISKWKAWAEAHASERQHENLSLEFWYF